MIILNGRSATEISLRSKNLNTFIIITVLTAASSEMVSASTHSGAAPKKYTALWAAKRVLKNSRSCSKTCLRIISSSEIITMKNHGLISGKILSTIRIQVREAATAAAAATATAATAETAETVTAAAVTVVTVVTVMTALPMSLLATA